MFKASLIIPAYNVENYIERCLNSATNQSLKDIEIIVVNDGSTDDTPQIINEYAKNDNRINVINKKNGGLSSARNAGIEVATGEYIFHLDGDDHIEKDALYKLYNKAKEKDADIVLCNYYIEEANGKVYEARGFGNVGTDYIKDFLLAIITPPVWNKFYKTNLYKDYSIQHPLHISMGEDLHTNTKLIYYSKKIELLPEPFVYYVQRNTSISKVYNNKVYDVMKCCNEIRDFLLEKGIYKKYSEEFIYLSYRHKFYNTVVVPIVKGKIHEDFYEDYRREQTLYKDNKYIKEFLKTISIRYRVIEKAYRIGYVFGNICKKIIIIDKIVKENLH